MNSVGIAWPGRERIMRDAGIRGRKTFDRAMRQAREAGLLVVERLGRRLSNRYHIGPALAGDGVISTPSHGVTPRHEPSQNVTKNAGEGVKMTQVMGSKCTPERAKGMINETRKPAPPVCLDSPPKAARRDSHLKSVNGDETHRPFGTIGVN